MAARAPQARSRNAPVTAVCGVCAETLPPGRARKWCSDSCRQAAWRRLHQAAATTPPVLPPGRPKRPSTVYECADCGGRLLGEQYCELCRTFMGRVGAGGLSPCCGEPVAFIELETVG